MGVRLDGAGGDPEGAGYLLLALVGEVAEDHHRPLAGGQGGKGGGQGDAQDDGFFNLDRPGACR